MKVLYLTGDYLYSKVHNSLIKELLSKDESLEVFVFSPVRVGNAHGLEDSYYNNPRLKVATPKVDIPIALYRIDFWAKQRSKVRLIEKNVPIKEIDVIYAGTLFSEGGTALRLHKKYNIPYFVSIRGTDVMTYSKRMPHLWILANRILKNSSSILCITPSIKNRMMSYWQYRCSKYNIEASQIVNNGIDDFWLENLNVFPKKLGDAIRVIYIGRFDINKNVLRLVEAVKSLKSKYNISLTLIGGKGGEHDEVVRQVELHKRFMEYLGPIYNKEELMTIIRRCDIFAMVSHSETFGLVYAECLTQGLPIIYTLGTGFSDFYPQGYVGQGVKSDSIQDIKDGLESVILNYLEIRNNISSLDFEKYSWTVIATEYMNNIRSALK